MMAMKTNNPRLGLGTKMSLLAAALVAPSPSGAAADPRVDSWLTMSSGSYARIYTSAANAAAGVSSTTWGNGTQTQALPAYRGVQGVYSSTTSVYVRTTGLGIHVMGPWPAGFPNLPVNRKALYRIPRNPTTPTTKTPTGLGVIGYFVDGVAMFDSRDGFVWTGAGESGGMGATGYWNRDAYVNEGRTFDPAFAHQEGAGNYHYHANPVALRYLLGDHVDYNPATHTYAESPGAVERHSPILGWVRDGNPIYGPYGYREANNAASGVRRMLTGYQLRNGANGTENLATTGRVTIPAWAQRLYGVGANQAGPAVSNQYPLGRYMEDNAYLGDLTNPGDGERFVQGEDFDLDEHNGRWCVTPEYPGGTYAYFVGIAPNGAPLYPYNIGRAFHGNPSGAAVATIEETVITNHLGAIELPARVEIQSGGGGEVTLRWSAVEGGNYRVESSGDLRNWKTNAQNLTSTTGIGQLESAGGAGAEFFRVARASLAAHDPATGTVGDGGGGNPAGPALTAVSPGGGARGTSVTVTLTLGGNPPPANLNPLSALLGTIAGTNLQRNGANVTGTFVIPINAAAGVVAASVVFAGPPGMGNVTFSLAKAFTIQ